MTTTADRTYELVIPLHAGQREIATDPARYRVAACGRRFGKSRLGAALAFQCAALGGIAWWVAPSYAIASIGWRHIHRLAFAFPMLKADLRQVDRICEFPNGGRLQVRSADNPDLLRGEGLDLAVLDEAAFMAEAVWTEAIRPSLTDRHGRALFLSTPNGNNWFMRLHAKGQDPLEPEYGSWNRPSWSNPYLDTAEIEAARRDMPEDTFRQEYGAEFMDTAGSYFRGVRLGVAERIPTGGCYVGVDWGDRSDYSVFTALIDGHVTDLVRLNQSGYDYQLSRLRAFCEQHQPAVVLAETNSMGTMTLERLQAQLGVPVQGFTTTAASKRELLDALKLGIETGAVTYPDIPVLLGELQAFRVTQTPAGNLQFSAPAGAHDDCVMSLALAHWAATRVGTAGSFADIPAYPVAGLGFRGL